MEIVSCDPGTRQMRFNVELEDGSGTVYARFQGWTDWLLNWPLRYAHAANRPECCVLSEEITVPGLADGSVATWVAPDFFAGADLEWAARLFLHSQEMPLFWAISAKESRRRFLVTRAAAKDAVRLWWSRKHGGPLPHPAEFILDHDAEGRPSVLLPSRTGLELNTELPHIRIEESSSGTVAVASELLVNGDLSLGASSEGRDTPVIIKSAS